MIKDNNIQELEKVLINIKQKNQTIEKRITKKESLLKEINRIINTMGDYNGK